MKAFGKSKRIVLSLILLVCVILSVSCNPQRTQDYTMGEISYTLPSYLKCGFSYPDHVLYRNSTDTVVVIVNALDSAKMLSEYGVGADATFEQFVEAFISKCGFDEGGMELDLEYNEEKTKLIFDVVVGPAPDEDGNYDENEVLQYYYYTIVKGTDTIYILQMFCAESDATGYVSLFKEWSGSVKLKG